MKVELLVRMKQQQNSEKKPMAPISWTSLRYYTEILYTNSFLVKPEWCYTTVMVIAT